VSVGEVVRRVSVLRAVMRDVGARGKSP
jgi:hypothetical protein